MGALAYLEWRYALHRIAALTLSPLRLIVWIPYLGFFALALVLRVSRHHTFVGTTAASLPSPAVLGASFAALFGLTIALSAGARTIAFRSPAEAVLLSNARLDPLRIVVWLQLRRVASAPARLIGVVVYLLAIVAPSDVGPAGFLRAVVSVILLGALLTSIQLPVFLLAARGWRVALRIVGITLAVLGAAYAIAAQLGGPYLRELQAALPLDFSIPVRLFEGGDTLSLAGLALLVAATVASIVSLGNDAFPDLYAASLAAPARRRRSGRLSSSGTTEFTVARPSSGTGIPGGAFVFFWKDWLAFVRARNQRVLWILGWCASIAVGAGIAYLRSSAGDALASVPFAAGVCVFVLMLGPAYASEGLAADVSKPLFWLGDMHANARVAAWTVARCWRGGLVLGLAPATAAAIAGNLPLAILAVPLATCVYGSLQALGVALYTILPNPLDWRGPMAIGRVIIATLYVAPAGFCAVLVLVPTNAPLLGVIAAAGVLVLEACACIALAAYRLTEFGATLATIARET